ncbi:MAG: hypothetical protein AAF961_03180 [Planctomycetota bacterium]
MLNRAAAPVSHDRRHVAVVVAEPTGETHRIRPYDSSPINERAYRDAGGELPALFDNRIERVADVTLGNA